MSRKCLARAQLILTLQCEWLSTIKKFLGKESIIVSLQRLDWLAVKSLSAIRGQADILRSLLMVLFSSMLSSAITIIVCKSPGIHCLLLVQTVTLLGLMYKLMTNMTSGPISSVPTYCSGMIPLNLSIHYKWVGFYSLWLVQDYHHSLSYSC